MKNVIMFFILVFLSKVNMYFDGLENVSLLGPMLMCVKDYYKPVKGFIYSFLLIYFSTVFSGIYYLGFNIEIFKISYHNIALLLFYFVSLLSLNVNVKILLSSTLFFIISNFIVWLEMYPLSISGIMSCYLLALPFYKNTLISQFLFIKLYEQLRSKLSIFSKRNNLQGSKEI